MSDMTGYLLRQLLTDWRAGKPGKPGITKVFLAALGTDGRDGFQCELGFGDGMMKMFQAQELSIAVNFAHEWAMENYK
jgi:hypothetical protein